MCWAEHHSKVSYVLKLYFNSKQDTHEMLPIGPIHTPSAGIFDDFDDEHGQNLLGSLHLDAEEEPVRRGTSRANSVRFDVSAIQGSNYAQGSQSSCEFGPFHPSSRLGSHPMIERSLSHKSDGRHSSAGHSVHSTHSALSGRTSSLGLDTNFLIGSHNDDSVPDISEPPPGFFYLGTVPSIIRCWLNENFLHSALLYAVVCTGSQNSHIDVSLVKELGLMGRLQKNVSGNDCIRLPVYLPEALVTQSASRTNSPAPQLPTLTVTFNVIGVGQRPNSEMKRAIRIFLGSDTLRTYSADILFSQNQMTLYGDDRNRFSVPFVRPEDETLFKNLCTTVVASEKVELNATAPPFTPIEQKLKGSACVDVTIRAPPEIVKIEADQLPPYGITEVIPKTIDAQIFEDLEPQKQSVVNNAAQFTASNFVSSDGLNNCQADNSSCDEEHRHELSTNYHTADTSVAGSEKRESPGNIWGTWRTGGSSNKDSDSNREYTSASSYHRPGRGGRSMKVLKPSKTPQRGRLSSTARTGASYEPPIQPVPGEFRRKPQAGTSDNNGALRWEAKRTISDEKPTKAPVHTNISRSSNPIGGASAFAWMNPGKVIAASARTD